MNQKERELRRRKIRMKLRTNGEDLKKRTGVNVHGDNFRHFMVKSAIYKVLQEAGHENIYTEVRFPNDCIADIFDTHTAHVYEVETEKTEKDTRAKWKDFDYPWVEDVIVLDPVEITQDIASLGVIKDRVKKELVLDA